MQNWKKRVFYGVLGTASLLLVACGNSADDSEAPTNAEGDIIMTVGQQTLQNPRMPEGDTYDDNAYRRVIKEKLDVEIETLFEGNGEDFEQQISLAMTAQEIPDMMVVGREEFEELHESGMIADLTDAFNEHASDYIKEIYDSYDGMQLEAATIDDRLMALPGTTSDEGPNMVWIRQDWMDQLGIDLGSEGDQIITLEELEETTRAFIENDMGETGNTMGLAFAHWLTAGNHGGTAYTADSIANAFGAFPGNYLQDSEGELFYGSNTEEMKNTLEYLNGLYEEGILDQQFGTRTWDDINAMMINGEIGVVSGPWHFPDWALSQAKATNPEAEFVPYTIGSFSGDGQVSSLSGPGVGGYIVVREGFQHPELAVEIINLIYDEIPNSEDMESEYPEMYEYTRLGVDGSVRPVNVEIHENLTALQDALEVTQGARGEIEIDSIENFGVRTRAEQVREYLENPEENPDLWAGYASRTLAQVGIMHTVREEGLLNEITPPVIVEQLTSEERNGAQINTLEEVAFIEFVTGERSLDTFDDYIDEWNSQGGEAILEERQSIIDER